jgi:rod shape-determining protein MreD
MSRGVASGVPAYRTERHGLMGAVATLAAIGLIVAAAVIQVSILTRLPLPGGTADLVLLVLIGMALARGPQTGALAGFGAGLVVDLMPPADHGVGQYAFVLCLAGYLLGMLGRRVVVDTTVGIMAVTAVTATGVFLGFAAIGALTGDPRVTGPAVVRLLPSVVLYTTALAPLVARPVFGFFRSESHGEFGAVITTRRAHRLKPLARRQEWWQ